MTRSTALTCDHTHNAAAECQPACGIGKTANLTLASHFLKVLKPDIIGQSKTNRSKEEWKWRRKATGVVYQ